MEILYITDVHDDLKSLRTVLQRTEADLYLISGDLIYKAFYTEDKLYHFLVLQENLYQFLKQEGSTDTPYELSKRVLQLPRKYSEQLRLDCAEYRLLFQKAAINMKEKYEVLRELVEKYAKAPTIMIPGNYDMDLQYTALHKYDLHKKHLKYGNITFAGYGGAPVITPGIPETLSVTFNEHQRKNELSSEPRQFFREHQPDILVVHDPAYGTLDKIASFGHCGSLGLREHIDNYNPALIVSGHVHEDYGLMRVSSTFCLNPSNFGTVETPAGWEPGGYFCRIYLSDSEDAYARQVIEYRWVENDIKTVCKVTIDRKGRASEEVVDEEEFRMLGRFLR